MSSAELDQGYIPEPIPVSGRWLPELHISRQNVGMALLVLAQMAIACSSNRICVLDGKVYKGSETVYDIKPDGKPVQIGTKTEYYGDRFTCEADIGGAIRPQDVRQQGNPFTVGGE